MRKKAAGLALGCILAGLANGQDATPKKGAELEKKKADKPAGISLGSIFDEFDKDKDGSLTKSESQKAAGKVDGQLRVMNGKIAELSQTLSTLPTPTYYEYQSKAKGSSKTQAKPEKSDGKKGKPKGVDADGDGKTTRDEFLTYYEPIVARYETKHDELVDRIKSQMEALSKQSKAKIGKARGNSVRPPVQGKPPGY